MTCRLRSCAARTGPTVWSWKRPSAMTTPSSHYHRSVTALSAILISNTMTMGKMICGVSSKHQSVLDWDLIVFNAIHCMSFNNHAYWCMGSILFCYTTIKVNFTIKIWNLSSCKWIKNIFVACNNSNNNVLDNQTNYLVSNWEMPYNMSTRATEFWHYSARPDHNQFKKIHFPYGSYRVLILEHLYPVPKERTVELEGRWRLWICYFTSQLYLLWYLKNNCLVILFKNCKEVVSYRNLIE